MSGKHESAATTGYLDARLAEIRGWQDKIAFGVSEPLESAVVAMSPFLRRNPNNIGIHAEARSELRGTRRIERDVIAELADLLGDRTAEGWLTSGGTEGNLTGMWLGRERLREQGARTIALATSELRHESIDRAHAILDLPLRELVPVDQHGRMCVRGLGAALKRLANAGADGLILVPVVGGSQTGACDPVRALVECATAGWPAESPFFVHVDACFGGLVVPFLEPEMHFAFHLPAVSSVTIDPHKMGRAPLGVGAFLVREGLAHLTELPSRIGPARNPTISGSRSGAAAVAAWHCIIAQGRAELGKAALGCVRLKEQLIASLTGAGLNIDAVHEGFMNVVALRFRDFPECRLPQHLEEYYHLTPSTLPQLALHSDQLPVYYAVKLMPHATEATIAEFTRRLVTARAQSGQEAR